MGSLPNELAAHTCPVCRDASESYRHGAEGRPGGFAEGAGAPALAVHSSFQRDLVGDPPAQCPGSLICEVKVLRSGQPSSEAKSLPRLRRTRDEVSVPGKGTVAGPPARTGPRLGLHPRQPQRLTEPGAKPAALQPVRNRSPTEPEVNKKGDLLAHVTKPSRRRAITGKAERT